MTISDNDAEGWIKIWRKIRKWEWYQDSKTVHVFLEILLRSQHEEKKWMGITQKAGQSCVSYEKLGDSIGLTSKQVRLCVKRLVDSGCISVQRASKFQLVTIEKWEDYQGDAKKEGNHSSPANPHESTNEQNRAIISGTFNEENQKTGQSLLPTQSIGETAFDGFDSGDEGNQRAIKGQSLGQSKGNKQEYKEEKNIKNIHPPTPLANTDPENHSVEEITPVSKSAKVYAFHGSVIKLLDEDYRSWQQRFVAPAIFTSAQLRTELERIDRWWLRQSEENRKNWFFRTAKMLEREVQKRLERRPEAPRSVLAEEYRVGLAPSVGGPGYQEYMMLKTGARSDD